MTTKQREFLSALVDLVSDSHFGAATKTWALKNGYATKSVQAQVSRFAKGGYSRVTIYSITDAGRAALSGAK